MTHLTAPHTRGRGGPLDDDMCYGGGDNQSYEESGGDMIRGIEKSVITILAQWAVMGQCSYGTRYLPRWVEGQRHTPPDTKVE